MLKCKDYIIKIIEETNIDFSLPKPKESYWMNTYLPIGNFKNIFLLPILYINFLISISLIFVQGTLDFGAAIIALVAIYLIIYDLIYKLKKRNSLDDNIDDTTLKKSFNIFMISIELFIMIVFCIILFYLFYTVDVLIFKLQLLIFLLCGICILFNLLFSFVGNIKISIFFHKLYELISLIYIVFMISVGIYVTIINNTYEMLIVLIPLIIFVIFIVYKKIKH